MSKNLKSIRTITVKKDITDLKNWTIRKGLTLYVMEELPKHPTLNYRLLLVRVDNGTGMLELMPETVIRDEVVSGD